LVNLASQKGIIIKFSISKKKNGVKGEIKMPKRPWFGDVQSSGVNHVKGLLLFDGQYVGLCV
jgi:hypothetical protein